MDPQPEGTIILVRHGETDANRCRRFAESNEIPLNGAGLAQANRLAGLLSRNYRASKLFSSEFLRARQTSEIIAAAIGIEAQVLAGIHERDFGCLKGHPYERMGELMSQDASYDSAQIWMWTPAGGESLEDVRSRASAALENLRNEHEAHQVIVVCHGAVIQAICAHITGEWKESWVPPNCGLVVINHDGGQWKHPVVSGEWECIPAYRNSRL